MLLYIRKIMDIQSNGESAVFMGTLLFISSIRIFEKLLREILKTYIYVKPDFCFGVKAFQRLM